MNQRPFLTLAVPTFRRPHRLAGLLDLLVRQRGIPAGDLEILVLDNDSGDSTEAVVRSRSRECAHLRYHRHERNIGSERNFRSAYDLASGEYVWILPDDDKVADDRSVAQVIERIRACPSPPSFVIMNARSFHLETNETVIERFNPIRGDVFLSQGRDILNMITDLDLIGLQRLVIRKDVFPDPFIDAYMQNAEYITCMVMSLVACTKGPALYIGEPHALFGEGDPTSWRVFWPHIALQLLPEMLVRSVQELGYPEETVAAVIRKRKFEDFARILPPAACHVLVFQRYKISWQRLARLFGWPFVAGRIIAYLPRTGLKMLNAGKTCRFLRDSLKRRSA